MAWLTIGPLIEAWAAALAPASLAGSDEGAPAKAPLLVSAVLSNSSTTNRYQYRLPTFSFDVILLLLSCSSLSVDFCTATPRQPGIHSEDRSFSTDMLRRGRK